MALIILDPNLESEAGHHLAYDLMIAKEALARGQAVTIVANQRFRAGSIHGVRILPHFSSTTYSVRHDDPVTGRFDDIRHFNDELAAELDLLPAALFTRGDAVLAPTVTETHLCGLVGWMKSFDPMSAPLFVVHLMFPSGVSVNEAGGLVVEDPIAALAYRLAGRLVDGAGPPVHVFASGRQHAVEFGALFGRSVPAHPLPIRPEPAPGPNASGQEALLFAGDARLDKGIPLLAPLLRLLAPTHPEWIFSAHVNADGAWGEAAAAAALFGAEAARHRNARHLDGRLAPEEYRSLLGRARLAVFPYDPQRYRRKSSGVLWEAISLGVPVIVPAETWLANEARGWGAGHVAYAAHEPEAIAAAFEQALAEIDPLTQASATAATRYRGANGAPALLDQIATLWVRQAAATSLVRRPAVATLDIAELDEGWHRPETVGGVPARWSAREPTIVFDWPFHDPWVVEVDLISHFGAAQIERAELTAGGLPVSMAFRPDGGGGQLRIRGPGPGRAKPRIGLRLRLAHTHRPATDARDLGILVKGIRILPDAAPPNAAKPTRPSACVLSAPAAAGGWSLAPTVSGTLATDGGAPCVLSFRLAAPSVEAMRGIALYLAGREVPVIMSAESDGSWLATAELMTSVVAGAAELPWDLLATDTAAGCSLLAVSAAPLGSPRLIEARAPATSEQPEEAPTASVVPAPAQAEDAILWDQSEGFGGEEGPFPDLGLQHGVRWIVARRARLVVRCTTAGAARIRIAYRSLLLRQRATVTVGSDPARRIDLPGGRLQQREEATIDITLPVGVSSIGFDFDGAVREPGTGRDLVLLLEEVTLDLNGVTAER